MRAALGYCAWGCFRYFLFGERLSRTQLRPGRMERVQSVFAFAALQLRRTPRFALWSPRGCATRSPKGEAWWARQDSNLQPDRYERPALTIELQAPPRAAARGGRQRCRHRLQGGSRSGNARASIHRNAGEFHHLAPLLGLVGDQLAEFGRRHRLRDAADLGEPRHQLGVLQRFADRLVEDRRRSRAACPSARRCRRSRPIRIPARSRRSRERPARSASAAAR